MNPARPDGFHLAELGTLLTVVVLLDYHCSVGLTSLVLTFWGLPATECSVVATYPGYDWRPLVLTVEV